MVWFVKRLQDFVNLCLFGTEKITTVGSFYSIADKLIDGKTNVNMSQYKGNVVVVTNVASQWGLTKKSYTQFNQLADDYGEKGLKILAFPCNQFGGQEPVSRLLEFIIWLGMNESIRLASNGNEKWEWNWKYVFPNLTDVCVYHKIPSSTLIYWYILSLILHYLN